MTRFTTIEEVLSYLEFYWTKRAKQNLLEFPRYRAYIEEHKELLKEAEKYCDINSIDFIEVLSKISSSTKGIFSSDFKLYINCLEDVENYIRWTHAVFPIKADNSERDFIWQTHCVQLEESLDYCFEHRINFMSVVDRVNNELHAETIANNIARFKKSYPHLVSKEAA